MFSVITFKITLILLAVISLIETKIKNFTNNHLTAFKSKT